MKNTSGKKLLDSFHSHLGLLVLRLVVGVSFMVHGYPKIFGGPERWEKLGGAMENLGIHFFPTFWGFMAAVAEFGGGLALILGLLTRVAGSGLAFTMFVAFIVHLTKGDGFNRMSHPLELLAVALLFVLGGAGKYSLDEALASKD